MILAINRNRRLIKRILLKIFYSFILLVLLGGLSFSGYIIALSQNEIQILINTEKEYQVINGFGASSAWTFQEIGKLSEKDQDDIIDKLYSKSGLDLNIYRFNIGAGSAETRFDNLEPYNDKDFDQSRRAESFFVSESFQGDYSVFSSINNYDFSKDQGSINMLRKAYEKGEIKKTVLFANSPHYLMTHSGKAIGEYEYQNNLRIDCFEAFSDYLLLIALGLYNEVISPLSYETDIYISPVNEPQWRWGGEGSTQEGCHYDPDILASFYQFFYEKLNDFNLLKGTSFKMEIFESGNYILKEGEKSRVKEYIDEFKKYEFYSAIPQLSFHSYGTNTDIPTREEFSSFSLEELEDKEIIMSEYCHMKSGNSKSISTGLYTGLVILRDLQFIQVAEWSWWLGVSDLPFEDGLVYWDHKNSSENSFFLTKRYYVYGHFSKYLTPGSKIVERSILDPLKIGRTDVIAAKNEDGIVVILINKSILPQRIYMPLQYENAISVTTTNEFNWKNDEYQYNGVISLPANSITTLLFSNDN